MLSCSMSSNLTVYLGSPARRFVPDSHSNYVVSMSEFPCFVRCHSSVSKIGMFCLRLSLVHSITCNNRSQKYSPASLIYHPTLILSGLSVSRCNPSLRKTDSCGTSSPCDRGWQHTRTRRDNKFVVTYSLRVLLELVWTFQFALSLTEANWMANCVSTESKYSLIFIAIAA